MPAILSWQPKECGNQVLSHLAAGECVVLPTESTYEVVASALAPAAVTRLQRFVQPEQKPAIVLFEYAQVFDWMPRLRGAAARLLRKMGPGPVTLWADGGYVDGSWSRLPAAVQPSLIHDQQMAVRWPAHPIWNELRCTGWPLISLPLEGAVAAPEAARLADENIACLVDAGATPFACPPSVVRMEGRSCCLQRVGGLTRDQFDELALCRILFICTGNTCRSPLAEILCAKLLADRLGCSVAELNRHGFCVQSAGLAAMMGSAASPEAVQVAAEWGVDLSQHHSCQVTIDMLLWADHVFTMTEGQCYTLEHIPAPALPRPRLLSPQGHDVVDPIGGALADYQACAQQIHACLQQRLPEFLES